MPRLKPRRGIYLELLLVDDRRRTEPAQSAAVAAAANKAFMIAPTLYADADAPSHQDQELRVLCEIGARLDAKGVQGAGSSD